MRIEAKHVAAIWDPDVLDPFCLFEDAAVAAGFEAPTREEWACEVSMMQDGAKGYLKAKRKGIRLRMDGGAKLRMFKIAKAFGIAR